MMGRWHDDVTNQLAEQSRNVANLVRNTAARSARFIEPAPLVSFLPHVRAIGWVTSPLQGHYSGATERDTLL